MRTLISPLMHSARRGRVQDSPGRIQRTRPQCALEGGEDLPGHAQARGRGPQAPGSGSSRQLPGQGPEADQGDDAYTRAQWQQDKQG